MDKLPKQLNYWIKKAGLIKTGRSKYSRKWKKYFSSLKGYGFYWRIDASGLLCRSCRIENFDRWSNSEDYEIDLGENEKEFLERVNYLKCLKEVHP